MVLMSIAPESNSVPIFKHALRVALRYDRDIIPAT